MSTDPTAATALRTALADWRRNGAAVGIVLVSAAVALALGSPIARYAAVLLAFCVWMLWFVLVAVDWIKLADF